MRRTKGVYVTRGRGLELEREMRAMEKRLEARVQRAEDAAAAASTRADRLLSVLENLTKATRRAPVG